MDLLRPYAVSATTLVSNVVDAAPAYDAATSYAEADIRTFGGRRWESLQGPNLNHEPGAAGSEDWWANLGADNPMAMFDRAVSTFSTAPDEILVEIPLDATAMVDAIGFLNVTATLVEVLVEDGTEGVVETRTISLLAEEGIIDAWTYCFDEFERRTDFLISDLPPYAGATLTISLSEPGGIVGCGVCIPGRLLNLGNTLWRPKLGFLDFSVKGPNEYGEVDVLEREWARIGEFQVWYPTSSVDALMRTLARYRATPVLWIGDDRFGATMIYGFFDEASPELSEADQSLLSLSLRGLI